MKIYVSVRVETPTTDVLTAVMSVRQLQCCRGGDVKAFVLKELMDFRGFSAAEDEVRTGILM